MVDSCAGKCGFSLESCTEPTHTPCNQAPLRHAYSHVPDSFWLIHFDTPPLCTATYGVRALLLLDRTRWMRQAVLPPNRIRRGREIILSLHLLYNLAFQSEPHGMYPVDGLTD